jgi:Na+-driven multidrug efflux pump
MHVTPTVAPYAHGYIAIRLLGSPLIIASFVLTSYLRGIGDTVTPMWVVLVANVFNGLASFVLVFGYLAFPALGVRGAAWGSVAASAVELSLYAIVYFNHETARKHGARHVSVPPRTEVREFLRIGLPIGLAWLFEMVAWTAFSIYAGTRPASELAAHTILFQVTNPAQNPG